MEMTDEAGNIVWSAKYKAWGEASITAKEGYKNPLRFQGQYFDHETGLHYNRHRYYDPQTGRFISKDPIGLAGGLNLHAYAPNPVTWVDPLGLDNYDKIQDKIEEIRNDGVGVRPGGVKAEVGKVELKYEIGKRTLDVEKPMDVSGNVAQTKKSTSALSVSVGTPCSNTELGVGSGSISFWKQRFDSIKRFFGDNASASLTPVGASANLACVNPVQAVKRTAAESVNVVINNGGLSGNAARVINPKDRYNNERYDEVMDAIGR
jgi:RHS repeat-associated protein